MKLRSKLVLALVGCTWVVSALVGVLSYRATQAGLFDEIDGSVVSAVDNVTRGPGPMRRGPLLRPDGSGEIALQVIDSDGAVMFSTADNEGTAIEVLDADRDVSRLTAAGRIVVRDGTLGDEPARVATRSLGEANGAIMGARSVAEVQRVLATLRTRILVVSLVVAVVAGLVGVVIARSITRRLTKLTAAAEQVAVTGELRVDVPREGNDETSRLGRAFDAMLGALSQSRERQQRLVQDAGHELRTPMTSLRTNLYTLREVDDLDADTRRRIVSDLEFEAVELSGLVEDVLAVAGGSDTAEVPEPVELTALVRTEADRVGARWNRSVSISSDGPIEAVCRRTQVARAVRNLVDNACKFSPESASVNVALTRTAASGEVPAGVSIEVSDSGPGIAPAELNLVFERFHRSDAARSLPGSGLGLSIVAEVAHAHGGRVWARNLGSSGGAAVGLWIPIHTELLP